MHHAPQASSSQRIFYEYVMLAGVNDGAEQAHELGRLLQVGPLQGACETCRSGVPGPRGAAPASQRKTRDAGQVTYAYNAGLVSPSLVSPSAAQNDDCVINLIPW
jgi:hypothetical protein